jgi:hypothetical protein
MSDSVEVILFRRSLTKKKIAVFLRRAFANYALRLGFAYVCPSYSPNRDMGG